LAEFGECEYSVTYDFSEALESPCIVKKDFCINCHSLFMSIRPNLKNVFVTKHFAKDFKDTEEVRSIVRGVLDCSNEDFHELHKFEEHIAGTMVFRAKKKGMHIVYCVDKKMQIIFLRAFRNFKDYKRFLEDKKEICNLITHI
jgi:mRNA-degrading endonuclease RelE of RelBE toxin-antitoxin system